MITLDPNRTTEQERRAVAVQSPTCAELQRALDTARREIIRLTWDVKRCRDLMRGDQERQDKVELALEAAGYHHEEDVAEVIKKQQARISVLSKAYRDHGIEQQQLRGQLQIARDALKREQAARARRERDSKEAV